MMPSRRLQVLTRPELITPEYIVVQLCARVRLTSSSGKQRSEVAPRVSIPLADVVTTMGRSGEPIDGDETKQPSFLRFDASHLLRGEQLLVCDAHFA